MSDINYATGRFGVVDIFHRNIWINYEDESIAHAIRKTFSSKAGLIIYDLSIFDNFVEDPPLIDSDCCLNWQIDFEINDAVTKISYVLGENEKTQTQHSSRLLINSSNEMLLSPERQKELQKQMMLYAYILKETKIHRELSTSFVREYQEKLLFDSKVDYVQIQSDFFHKINTIFSRELYLADINKQLRDLADQLLTIPTLFAASYAALILTVTGGIYA